MRAKDWLPLLTEIADRGDRIALDYFGRPDLDVTSKGADGPVTAADREIEQLARAIAMQRAPELGFLGEETGAQSAEGDTRLIVDPIDGTANFARGIPVFATLLAIEADREVVASLVSAPAFARRWHAVKGEGAWSSGRRLQVSGIARIPDAQIFHSGLGDRGDPQVMTRIAVLAQRAQRSRGFGDFWQHVLVAEGAGEAAIDPAVSAWDVAALKLLVEEAGGRATTLGGEINHYGGSLVTSNGLIHEEVLRALG
ncbi:MAG: inositol monophosphatase family protein [Burkholderiales bacterium]